MAETNEKDRGSFFRIDLNSFRKVCELESINCVQAYLILASGTDRSNRFTRWSADAVASRTTMSWKAANKALERLRDAALLATTGSRKRPNHELLVFDQRPALTAREQEAVDRLRSGLTAEKRDATYIAKAKEKGWIAVTDGLPLYLERPEISPVWLPNVLVTRLPQESRSLLNRIANARDPMAFALLVELYSIHDLPEADGIDRRLLWRDYKRALIKTVGAHYIWRFDGGGKFASGATFTYWRNKRAGKRLQGDDVWPTLHTLEQAGAIEWVTMVFEGSDDEASPIHPLGLLRNWQKVCSAEETLLGNEACAAAEAIAYGMNTTFDEFLTDEDTYFLPFERLAKDLQVFDVARLVYRPKTQNTARWRKSYTEQVQTYREHYEGLSKLYAPHMFQQENGLVQRVRYQGEINASPK